MSNQLIPIIADGQTVEIDVHDNFSAVIPAPGMRVDVPDFFEINARSTLEHMKNMTEREWQHIRSGPLFKYFWDIMFPYNPNNPKALPIPATIAQVNAGDFGIAHLCGLIILSVDAFSARKNVYYRTPEDLLHPQQHYHLMTLIKALHALGGHSDEYDIGGERL